MPQDLFQANLIELLGLTSLPRERQLAILNKVTDLIQKRVILRIIEELSEEDKVQAEKILNSGTDDEKAEFIKSKTNFQQILEHEITKVKQELLEDVGQPGI